MNRPKTIENNKIGELCTHLGLLISLENKTNLSSKYHGNQPAPSIGNYVNKSAPKSGDMREWGSINQMSNWTHMVWFNRPYILIGKST